MQAADAALCLQWRVATIQQLFLELKKGEACYDFECSAFQKAAVRQCNRCSCIALQNTHWAFTLGWLRQGHESCLPVYHLLFVLLGSRTGSFWVETIIEVLAVRTGQRKYCVVSRLLAHHDA